MARLRYLALAAALACAAAPAAAQQFHETAVTPGEYGGELTTRHPTLRDGSYADCMLLQTERGRGYTITMRSTEFDTYLIVDPSGCQITDNSMRNDDFERASTNSQIVFTGTGARFGIIVNSYAAGATGRFRLLIEEGPPVAQTAQRAPYVRPTDPNYNVAIRAFNEGDYDTAARLFPTFVRSGDHWAQYAMGYMTFWGRGGLQRNYAEGGRLLSLAAGQGNQEAQDMLNLQAGVISQAMFVEHIDRNGPDMSDSAAFNLDVAHYCVFRGPNCQEWRARAYQFERAENQRAEWENMRRIWGLYTSPSSNGDSWAEHRERSECMRRVTESIQRQTYGQQTWRYVNNC